MSAKALDRRRCFPLIFAGNLVPFFSVKPRRNFCRTDKVREQHGEMSSLADRARQFSRNICRRVRGHNCVLWSQRLRGGYQCDPTLYTEFCGGWVVATTVGTTTLQRSATLVTEICAGSSVTMAGLATHPRLPPKNTNVRTVVIVPRIRSIHFKQFLLSPRHPRPNERAARRR